MKKMTILVGSLVLLLALCGIACAGTASDSGSGVLTNVYFCKMIKVNDTYELQPLPTQYTGENDYGRYTFVSVSKNLEAGDYAIVENTSKGLELIQSMSLEPSGTPTPEYVMLTIELTKDQLPEPLEIMKDQTTGTTAALTPSPTTSGSNPASSGSPASPASAVPTATKSPGSLPVVLIGLGITGIVLHACRRP